MRAPKPPPDEEGRLAALAGLGVLDTPAEERFDRITRLATRLFDVPIALVSLVDRDRQWFKSRQGLAATETPRDVSFCGHAILEPEPLIVGDARKDERFRDNPLVAGNPDIRFYAGQPLHTLDRHRVGTLCVIDRVPRTFGADDRGALLDLARLVEGELNLASIDSVLAELERARLTAELASEAKSRFLANMSHELRTPLNAMIGFSRVLVAKHATELDGRARTMLERVQANGEHLLELINDILDVSRIEAGRLELVREPVDVRLLVRETVQLLEGRVSPERVTLSAEVPWGLAPLPTDRVRLRQVLINLIGNGLKFTDEGSVTVRVTRDTDGGVATIEVRDTGIGIPRDQIEQVLEPFERASTGDGKVRVGTGLGLAIARSICGALGFGLELESTPGRGTIARVRMHPDA